MVNFCWILFYWCIGVIDASWSVDSASHNIGWRKKFLNFHKISLKFCLNRRKKIPNNSPDHSLYLSSIFPILRCGVFHQFSSIVRIRIFWELIQQASTIGKWIDDEIVWLMIGWNRIREKVFFLNFLIYDPLPKMITKNHSLCSYPCIH